MSKSIPASDLVVEPAGESSGACECCGNVSRRVSGWIHAGERTVAAYAIRWTPGHVQENGAEIDLIIGAWGEESSAADRVGVSLVHFEREDGPWGSVTDAAERPLLKSDLVGSRLRRDEVVGTPLAAQVFSLVDAVYLQDARLLE